MEADDQSKRLLLQWVKTWVLRLRLQQRRARRSVRYVGQGVVRRGNRKTCIVDNALLGRPLPDKSRCE